MSYHNASNTIGVAAGSFTLVGGENITVSKSGQAITIDQTRDPLKSIPIITASGEYQASGSGVEVLTKVGFRNDKDWAVWRAPEVRKSDMDAMVKRMNALEKEMVEVRKRAYNVDLVAALAAITKANQDMSNRLVGSSTVVGSTTLSGGGTPFPPHA